MSTRPTRNAAAPPPVSGGKGQEPVLYCWTCGRVISPRKSHIKNPTTPPRYCSDRCRNHRPRASHESLERKIEDAFVELLCSSRPSIDTSSKVNVRSRSSIGNGASRRVVLCSEVETLVFNHKLDPDKVYGRRRNRAKRGVKDDGEWKSVDMIDRFSGPAEGSPDPISSDDDEEVAGVRIHLSLSRAVPSTASASNVVSGSRLEDAPQLASFEDLEKRRMGQQRAEEREMVRQAARRGVAFGFSVRGEYVERRCDSVLDDMAGGELKKCEAVQNGKVVEASFAKGEWGVRWQE